MVLVLSIVVVALVAARLWLPTGVRWYVNRALAKSRLYDGVIGEVDVHLWRGAYSIEDVKLLKVAGNVPVPFLSAERVDLAIEWASLLHGAVVGRIVFEKPELNFVDADNPSDSQTGSGGPWLSIVRDLFPFKIDSAEVRDGRVAFRAFDTQPPVDVYLSAVNGTVTNLTNIRDETAPLCAVVQAEALAMDHADVDFRMELDPFAYHPTFRLALRLIGLDVTKANSLGRAYGAIDFEHGWFDLLLELEAKQGYVEGYVKPLFRNLRVFDIESDVRIDLLSTFWEALVGAVGLLFRNQAHDQLATLIPVHGELDDPSTDFLSTLGNLLHNAFVRAFLPQFHGSTEDFELLRFDAGTVALPEGVQTR